MSYATLSDLATFLNVPQSSLPTYAQRWLDMGSELVDYVTMNRMSLTDDIIHTEAAKKAVLYQYEFWTMTGIDTDILGNAVQSFTVGQFSMTFDNSNGSHPATLAPRARRVLINSGLYYRGVRMV